MVAILISIAALTLVAIIFLSCASAKTKHILDSDGRITIYHGINVANSGKHSPDHLPWTTKEDLARLKTWGFNLVRYLVFWEAIEPTEGNIDSNYINATRERITWLQELGIDVIVDIHQDIYASKFTGNGFPVWTINDDGLPFTEQHPWSANLLEPAVIASYKNFWTNETLKKKYVELVKLVFAEFADPFSNVLGVDVMNEPFPIVSQEFVKAIKEKKITDIKAKYLTEIANFEKQYLDRLYTDIAANVKTNKKIFFEPVIYTSAGIPSRLKFKPEDNWVYYPHYYDPFCHESKPYKETNEKLMKASVLIKNFEAYRFRTPILYGEWGIGQTVENFQQYIIDFMNLADKHVYGWTYFCYDPGHPFSPIDANKEETPQCKTLVRPYPQKIAGINPKFKITGNVFELTYELSGKTTLPGDERDVTIIFVPGAVLTRFKVETDGYVQNADNLILYHNTAKKIQKIKITF